MQSFRQLNSRTKISVFLLYARINLKIVFGLKAMWFLAGAAVYIVVLCLIALNSGNAWSIAQALPLAVWIPVTIIAVLFSMDIISKERDANLIETLFTVSVSVYRLWIIKFVTLMVCLTLLAYALIVTTDLFIVDLPILVTLVNVLPPVLFFASLTMLFSVMFKSANAAAMVVTAILAFVMLVSEGLSTTVVYPYLNPFTKPVDYESFVWIRMVVYNKIAYTLFGCVWFWRALRWLDRRERLLK